MATYTATIHTSEDDSKGRSFQAVVLAAISADAWWDCGTSNGNLRPIFLVVGSSEGQLRPFVTNLRLGKKAEFERSAPIHYRAKLEYLKTAKVQGHYQRMDSGVTATMLYPEPFSVNPGMVDPNGISFLTLVRSEDLDPWPYGTEVIRSYAETYHDYREAPRELLKYTPYFIQQLDHRTRAPLLNDPDFFSLLFYALVSRGLAGIGSEDTYRRDFPALPGLYSVGLEQIGFAEVVGMRASHEDFEAVLKRVTAFFLNRKK